LFLKELKVVVICLVDILQTFVALFLILLACVTRMQMSVLAIP